ncbi:LysM peptidoglycan-binding domain-containing protein [Streptomyces sp. NBC_00439]|uniref:LysM peptidoglycan-binding domain-containing protein n=1 Tax=Streptomyces sp. NBC_00439 TaxID=2903650 RepID=UPI002252C7FA|nr:LysM peptidoglycan-binding domain-containing protein [Streptomyces sp. NBC_00439]MCX5106921.1 LysM peptidoglycan-binding domain-containing protein [Streptomyces sp. NBC_00439]
MRTTHSPAPAGSPAARVLKALGSLLVLAGAVGGLPLLLAWVTPVIWAAGHDDLAHLLDRQDTGTALLLLLVAVGWIGWAQFTFCAVRELIAQLRGRTWHAPRGLGSSQRAAAALIGGILVLLPTSSALASPATAAPTASAVHVPGQAQQHNAGQDQALTSRAGTDSAKAPADTLREVRAGESLWSIAEKDLGDGEQWREIAALNDGQTMPDGQVFRSNSFLQPGWQLRMPQKFTTAAPEETSSEGTSTQLGEREPVRAGASEKAVTVVTGDNLTKIAEKELGDGNQWPKLFAASQGKPQPDGLPKLTDPDMIYAGQQVTVPAAPSGRHDRTPDNQADENPDSRPHTPPTAEDPQDEPDKDDAPAPKPDKTTDHPAPEASPSSTTPARPGNASTSPSPQASHSETSAVPPAASRPSPTESATPSKPAAPPATSPATADSPLQLRTAAGAGALLAAAITGALAVRRVLQRRRRQPGEKIVIASETSPAEAQLSAAAEPGGATRLDRALRTLAHTAGQNGEETPLLRAARIGTRSLEILPEDLSQEPQAPFAAGQAGWWQLPDKAELLDEEEARDVPAPYPGLVTVGSTESGDLVLANLAQLPAVLLDGNPVHITEVCTSLALELGMSPWAPDIEVVTIGFGEDLPQLLPTSRIAHMRQPAHALRDLAERLLEAHQMPETAHQPYLLLCATVMDADTAWQFAEAIDKAGRVPVTLIAPASTAAAHFPEAEILNASLSTPQHFDHLGTEITVQRLEHAAYQQITAALTLSGQPAEEAEGPWQEVPYETGEQPPADPAITEAGEEDATPAPVPSAANDSGEVFPALLAASADPSALRLLPPAPGRDQTGNEPQNPPPAKAPETDPAAPEAAQAPHPATQKAVHTTADDRESDTHDLTAPEIRVLGPVEVDRVGSTGHGPRTAQLAALMFFRPGRTADVLCTDMDPLTPWSATTLNARLQGLRHALGNDPAGNAYVPRRRRGDDPYRLAPAVRCDWTRFLHLAERALPHAAAGLPDLEKALSLVRGRPFGTRPMPWAEPYQQEMITRIIDVAHTVATYRTATGPHHDLGAARQAIVTGLEVDETAELLYRDWMRIEAAAGNRSGVHMAISRVQQVNRALDCDPELETEQLIGELLNSSGTKIPKAL